MLKRVGIFFVVVNVLKAIVGVLWAQRKISGDKLFLLLLHHGTV